MHRRLVILLCNYGCYPARGDALAVLGRANAAVWCLMCMAAVLVVMAVAMLAMITMVAMCRTHTRILGGVLVERSLAAGGAEVICCPFVVGPVLCSLGIYGHSTHRIYNLCH
jgi:hypothetical protein